MRRKIIYCFLITALTHPACALANSGCTQWVAKIASLQGKVQVKHLNHSQWKNADADATLCPGDSIRTLAHSRLILSFFNHSVTTLDEYSTLIFPASPSNAKSWFLNLLEGTAFFRSRKDQELDIHTPFINAVHKGTEFWVSVNNDKAQVAVLDGEVLVKNQAGQVHIKKGDVAEAHLNQAPQVHPLTITPENAVQWTLYYPPVIDYQARSYPASAQPALKAYQQGDVYAALEALAHIPPTDQNSASLTLYASLLLTVGRVDEARRVLAQNTSNSTSLALQAIIAVAQNQPDAALSFAHQAIALNAQSDVAHIALSYAYQSQLKIEEALKAAQSATTVASNNALAWARVSELQLSVGNLNTALIAAQKAQALNPNMGRVQVILGFAELAVNNIERAETSLQQAIHLDSSDPLARLGLGLTKIRQGQWEAGKNELELAVNLDPNNAVLRSYLGKSFFELKNNEFASKEFEIAKAMDAKNPTPWLYDAILKQTTNHPVAALRDMQKAIELNNNRGVYRSSLLLDEDKAVRSASLGRIYKTLGFDDAARQQATASLTADPGNYSAHRLLADSYLYNSRQDMARASELLQAQLLQPLNYNPIQPQLAYTDLNIIKSTGFADVAFNEYSHLFEGNRHRLTATGLYGSYDTRADEAVLSGIQNRFAYSLGQMHYQTDGFRTNAGLTHNLYNAFGQYEFSPQVSLQAEYRHRDTKQGDLQLQGMGFSPDDHYLRKLEQDSYRLGLKVSPAPHSDLLFSFIYSTRQESKNQTEINASVGSKGYNLETQYLFHTDDFNTVLGGSAYLKDDQLGITLTDPTLCEIIPVCGHSKINSSLYSGYLYSTAKVFDKLDLTAGFSYDAYQQDSSAFSVKLNKLNPKLSFNWQVNDAINLRAAWFRTVRAPIFVNQFLQPTQLAGFNQFLDDPDGSIAWQYGVGIDTHFHKDVRLGIETLKRDIKTPVATTESSFFKRQEELFRFYFNWIPHENWVINSEYRFENFHADETAIPKHVKTSYLPVSLRFFNESGFFSELKGTWVNQHVKFPPTPGISFNSSFILIDAALGYRLPKSYGMISLEAKNLLDKHFEFRDRQFQMNEQRAPDFIPERTLFARFTLNF